MLLKLATQVQGTLGRRQQHQAWARTVLLLTYARVPQMQFQDYP